jgi:hypothetical protein
LPKKCADAMAFVFTWLMALPISAYVLVGTDSVVDERADERVDADRVGSLGS